MATKMELVLSPGNLGGEGPDGGPFRNEDVREWSRVDRITGMLERARVETGRWRANTRDAAQSYGKMIDSRERNSADGSLVQKARRQVEIFQSQGASGRSFQVVRASQWSSSKATDCVFDVPLAKPNNSHFFGNGMNGTDTSLSPGLSLWRSSLADKSSDLEQLSCLCRKLHDEALSQSKFWSLRPGSRSPSPLLNDASLDHHLNSNFPALGEPPGNGSSSLAERRSNSSEDLASLPSSVNVNDDAFARDCRTRRSLQITGSGDVKSTPAPHEPRTSETESRRLQRRNELVAERARKFEENARRANAPKPAPRTRLAGSRAFASIADNDFVRNDPNHPSKLGLLGQQQQQQQLAKVNVQEQAQNGQSLHASRTANPEQPQQQQQQQQPVAPPRKANNKTVVHLRNSASPTDVEPARCINVTAIKLEKDAEPRIETSEYAMLLDATSASPGSKDEEKQLATVNGTKPVKKVEFCKTEIHFAPDSGKVNIVETDGKPPPTNKFRRRRRNNSIVGVTSGARVIAPDDSKKSNMPLVHFGDTSYEKFIFGGQGKPPQDCTIASNPAIEDNRCYGPSELEPRQRWSSPEKIGREDGIVTGGKELLLCATKDASLERVGSDHGRHRGAHTTTVNFLGSENTNAVSKLGEGTGIAGIRLQFAASSRSLSPVNLSEERSVVSRTTKITVHLRPPQPAVLQPYYPAQLQLHPFSNLKSVRLVMRIGRELGLERLFSSLCNTDADEEDNDASSTSSRNERSAELLSLEQPPNPDAQPLRTSPDAAAAALLHESRMLEDKPGATFPATSHVPLHQELDRQPGKAQVVSQDSDNNQVLLKIVTTHKPTLARVENDHPLPKARSSRSLETRVDEVPTPRARAPVVEETIETVVGRSVEEAAPTLRVDPAKEHCDTSESISGLIVEAPTYENVFDAIGDGAPLYENFQVPKASLAVSGDGKAYNTTAPVTTKAKSSTGSQDRREPKLRSSQDKSPLKTRPERVKSSRSVTPMSSLSSVKSERNTLRPPEPHSETKRLTKSSSRSSTGSRDSSTRKYKDAKPTKEDGSKTGQAKRKNGTRLETEARERKTVPSNGSLERNGGSLRSKKPVEVVYQTAVYNIKNEKLSKPKVKETKGPRLINDLICGSKTKRPSDKKIVKTAILSQNTSKRKQTPAVMNR